MYPPLRETCSAWRRRTPGTSASCCVFWKPQSGRASPRWAEHPTEPPLRAPRSATAVGWVGGEEEAPRSGHLKPRETVSSGPRARETQFLRKAGLTGSQAKSGRAGAARGWFRMPGGRTRCGRCRATRPTRKWRAPPPAALRLRGRPLSAELELGLRASPSASRLRGGSVQRGRAGGQRPTAGRRAGLPGPRPPRSLCALSQRWEHGTARPGRSPSSSVVRGAHSRIPARRSHS